MCLIVTFLVDQRSVFHSRIKNVINPMGYLLFFPFVKGPFYFTYQGKRSRPGLCSRTEFRLNLNSLSGRFQKGDIWRKHGLVFSNNWPLANVSRTASFWDWQCGWSQAWCWYRNDYFSYRHFSFWALSGFCFCWWTHIKKTNILRVKIDLIMTSCLKCTSYRAVKDRNALCSSLLFPGLDCFSLCFPAPIL